MRYFLILFVLFSFVYANDFIDKNASSVTKQDLELMKEFDNLAYDLSDEELKPLDITAIYNFIKLHKEYITDYSLATVDFKASAGIDNYDYENSTYKRDKEFQRASISLNYPIFDEKTRKDIKNKKMEYKFKILDEIKKYVNLRDKFIGYKRELKFNRLVQIKEKLQVKKGVKYLDDKLKTIEKILDLQNKILEVKSELVISESNLLNYVKNPYREKLKELLK